MSKGRLFFSHSTEAGSAGRDIVTRLAAGLAGDYEILLDRQTLQPGVDWRSTINVWLGICDAAVILIDPASIDSEFCQYEWAILGFRRRSMLVVPIYHGSKPNDIKGRPDQIFEIGGYLEYADIGTLTDDLKAKLAALVERKNDNVQMALIATSLKRAIELEESLDILASKVTLDLGNWNVAESKWLKLAIKIMGLGLALPGRKALREVRKFFRRSYEKEFADIVTLVGYCSWVDAHSVERIKASCANGPARLRVFGLNAENAETALGYVLSASENLPDDNWPVGQALGVFASYADLRLQVESALRDALKLPRDAKPDGLKQVLDRRQKEEQPVFVVLRSDGLDAQWLKQLCEEDLFGWVTFLVVTGAGAPTPGLIPDEAWLRPALSTGFEQMVWDNYEQARDSLLA